MNLHMLRVRFTYEKIRRRVVGAVEVPMVHLFTGRQCSAETRFHDHDVLENVSFPIRSRVRREQHFLVTVFQNERLLEGPAIALATAKCGAFALGKKLCPAQLARLGLDLSRRGWRIWRSVSVILREVVRPAKPFGRMAPLASGGSAEPRWARALPLLKKILALLPAAIASRATEWARSVCTSDLFDSGSALGACMFTHVPIVHDLDIYHVSIEHGGRK